jgi:Protein of unknown function (DUF742)
MTSDRDGRDGRDGEWAEVSRPYLDRSAASGPSAPFGDGGGNPDDGDPGTVRPYLLTGGRTASRQEVNIETMVTPTGAKPNHSLDDVHLQLLRLAREPMAVAELASYLEIPIGVAMILVGDLAEIGVVSLNDVSSGSLEPADDASLIRKVVHGVLKLRNAESV